MRRLARPLFNLCLGLLLLLFVASCALWAGSYGRSAVGTRSWAFRSRDGQAEVIRHQPASPGIVFPPGMPSAIVPEHATSVKTERWYLGQVCRSSEHAWDWTKNTTSRTQAVYVRYSLPMAVGAIGIAATGWRRVRARRARVRVDRGLCGACGYDLRASPGWCPECGAIPTQPQAHA